MNNILFILVVFLLVLLVLFIFSGHQGFSQRIAQLIFWLILVATAQYLFQLRR